MDLPTLVRLIAIVDELGRLFQKPDDELAMVQARVDTACSIRAL